MTEILVNPNRRHGPVPEPEGLGATEPLAFLAACPAYAPTPLRRLPGLARRLGVRQVLLKDESQRMGLSSFKALGGVYAVLWCARAHASACLGREMDPRELVDPEIRMLTSALHFVCASDGNHGRAVAAGARLIGARCSVYLHAHVSEERAGHIHALGAAIVRCPGGYDDSVARARIDSAREGWTLISDTIDDAAGAADPVPMRVMQGYGVMAEEIMRETGAAERPTHLFVQAGVGGLAAALAGRFAALASDRPRIVVVEPDRAACLLESCRAGSAVEIPDHGSTVYAMLECRRPSLPAWRILRERADFFMSVGDALAATAVAALANAQAGDPPAAIGASGSAGLAGAIAAAADPQLRARIALNPDATILLIGTEGITDVAGHARLIRTADLPLAAMPSKNAG